MSYSLIRTRKSITKKRKFLSFVVDRKEITNCVRLYHSDISNVLKKDSNVMSKFENGKSYSVKLMSKPEHLDQCFPAVFAAGSSADCDHKLPGY